MWRAWPIAEAAALIDTFMVAVSLAVAAIPEGLATVVTIVPNAFLEGYLDALLTCGRAIGEIVPAAGNREIAAVLWGRVEDIEIRETF